ncbi:protein NO VEIN domain-containing protein [Aeromonas salmonicida]
MNKILWVKFGWSEYYRGGPVDGNFGWLHENKGKKGHEAFNFSLGPDGAYYCYVPPQAGEYAPSNDDPNGWTVICLAKNPKHTGIHIVGWYENATLHGEWLAPPDGMIKKRGDAAHPAYDWSYCISSKTVYFVPPEHRSKPFSDPSVRHGKYSFLEGPNVETNENKQRVLKLLSSLREEMAPFAIYNPNEDSLPDPELDAVDPLKGFGTPEHRKEVELAAELAVIEHYERKGYAYERVTHLPCGYDFVFTKGKSVRHVEVKGTSSSTPRFFITRNEYGKGLQSNPAWRLVMVTSALSETPSITEYNASELKKAFDFEPYVYIGKYISKPNS